MKRQKPWFKIFPDDYLWGSTKAELKPDERSVWIDFLCIATYHKGFVDITYPKELACKFIIPLPLLNRCIKKFEKFGKIKIIYEKKEKKKLAKITKWEKYQHRILTSEGERSEKDEDNDATLGAHLRCDSNKDKIRRDKKREEEREENGLPSIPKNLEFKTRDVLIEKRAWVRKLRKLYEDKDWERGRSERTEEELLEEIREAEKDYCDMVDEYKD